MMPVGVEVLTRAGHEVFIEAQAGVGSGFSDEDYKAVGGKIVGSPKEVFDAADMLVKVKEPQPGEISLFRPGQIVFTYFHFAASPEMSQGCLESEIVAIAYETIKDRQGRLPCLTPMSEMAGKMSIQEGAKYLEKPMMGRGILLGGVPGVAPAMWWCWGRGWWEPAAKVAAGLGAEVVLMDINLDRLRYLDDVMPENVKTIFSDAQTVREHLNRADLVIGAVLIPGADGAATGYAKRSHCHEEWERDRGCRDRPGGQRGDKPADDAPESHVCGRWRGALLRGEHARRGGPDKHDCAVQRHASVRAADSEQRIGEGRGGGCGTG